jgi:hypothetical protein
MEKIKSLFIVITLFFCCKSFSQTSTDPIVDSCAYYQNNVSYNTGEVFVIFTVQNQDIVSKTTEENQIDTAVAVYPNPVSDVLNVSFPKDQVIESVTLYSIEGKIIFSQTLKDNQIDLSGLLKGVYILKTNLSETDSFKIIKM